MSTASQAPHARPGRHPSLGRATQPLHARPRRLRELPDILEAKPPCARPRHYHLAHPSPGRGSPAPPRTTKAPASTTRYLGSQAPHARPRHLRELPDILEVAPHARPGRHPSLGRTAQPPRARPRRLRALPDILEAKPPAHGQDVTTSPTHPRAAQPTAPPHARPR